MKVKTSVTLPDDLLEEIDRLDNNRSAFLERAARQYLDLAAKSRRDAQDMAIIERNIDRLNAEALDALDYQGLPE